MPRLLFPVLDGQGGNALEVGKVVRDHRALSLQCRSRDQQIGIRQQLTTVIQLSIEACGSFDDAVGQRKDETGLAEGIKRGFLDTRLFDFEPTQNFISRDRGEGEPVVLGQI